MNINPISFRGQIPVDFYARHPQTGYFVPIVKPEHVKKCQSFVVRNLNGTAKKMRNADFVNIYKKADKDYAYASVIRTYYDREVDIPKKMNEPVPHYVYLVTGKDAEIYDNLGKELGIAKRDYFERTGQKYGYDVQRAKTVYQHSLKDLVFNKCKKVKTEKGKEAALQIFFEPHYNKKGELDRFDYAGAFISEDKKPH